MHAVVGAVIAASAQFLEHTLRRAALPLGQVAFLLQDLCQNLDPVTKLGRGLNPALVLKLGPVPADDLANRRARHRQRAYDFLDRPTLLKIGAPYLADLVHANHPRQPFPAAKAKRKDAVTSRQRGSELDAKRPLRGSILQAILQLEAPHADRHAFCRVE